VSVETAVNDMIDDARVGALVLTVRDVTERKAFEEQLRHRAFHDPLTHLPNRALFQDRLQHALSRDGRYEDKVAVLFIDLDDFKVINDTLGHAAGDELLTLTATRLRSCLRSADTPARHGGDEFGVLLESVRSADQAVDVAERILAAFKEQFLIGGRAVALKLSVGVALGEAHVTSADELQREADIAMYVAKRGGKEAYALFRPDEHADLALRFPSAGSEADRTTWVTRNEEQRNEVLRLLRDETGIVPAFQPIMDLATGELAGYEVLARFPARPRPRRFGATSFGRWSRAGWSASSSRSATPTRG
jgi:diguanylate cyclase (GGDEF)-like protein